MREFLTAGVVGDIAYDLNKQIRQQKKHISA